MANLDALGFLAKKKAVNVDNALKYHEIVLEMLQSRDYEYADFFLASVLQQIEDKEFISVNQMASVEKIKSKTGKPKRRYRR